MYNLLKLAIVAMIFGSCLAALPAAQAQAPSSGFNFTSPSGTGSSGTKSHVSGLLSDPSTQAFLISIGALWMLNDLQSGGGSHNSGFSQASSPTPSFSSGILSGKNLPGGGLPAAVPEGSTSISFGLMLALGVGGMALSARRRAKASQLAK